MVRWNGTWTIIRNFLFGIVNKEFLIFLFFLALSGGFWLMMSLNETCEQDIPVPVRLVNVPSNAVITDNIDDTVMVTIRDKGFSIFSYLYGSKFRVVTLDFENYARKGGVGVIPASEISLSRVLTASSTIFPQAISATLFLEMTSLSAVSEAVADDSLPPSVLPA